MRIPGIRPIAERLLNEPGSVEFWNRAGEAIGQFHAAGVNHADLSAYNVQVDTDDKLWVLDFDRGRISSNGPWRQQNIARLHRSFMKVSSLDDRLNFSDEDWEQLHQLNLMSAVRCTRHWLPHMREQQWGRVVMVASPAARYPSDALIDYAATKAAMVATGKPLAGKYGRDSTTSAQTRPTAATVQ